jgi:hypothetical protein
MTPALPLDPAAHNGLARQYLTASWLAAYQTARVLAMGPLSARSSRLLLSSGSINRLRLLPSGSHFEELLTLIHFILDADLTPAEQDTLVLDHFQQLLAQRAHDEPVSAATRAANTAAFLAALKKGPNQ